MRYTKGRAENIIGEGQLLVEVIRRDPCHSAWIPLGEGQVSLLRAVL